MSAYVFVEQTPVSGREIPVMEGAVVGRGHCDVVLVDPEVSRRHAIVVATPAGPAIEDLGSTNGTWVNGQRISGAHRLRPGDMVRFGNTIWHVHTRQEGTRDLTTTADVRTTVPPDEHPTPEPE